MIDVIPVQYSFKILKMWNVINLLFKNINLPDTVTSLLQKLNIFATLATNDLKIYSNIMKF